MRRKKWDKSKLDLPAETKRLLVLAALFLPAYINAILPFQLIWAVAVVLYFVGGNPLHPVRSANRSVVIEKLADILMSSFVALVVALACFILRLSSQRVGEEAFWAMGLSLVISIPLAQFGACIKYLYMAKRCTTEPSEQAS